MAGDWTTPRVEALIRLGHADALRNVDGRQRRTWTGGRGIRGMIHWRVARWLVANGYAESSLARDRVGRLVGTYLTITDTGREALRAMPWTAVSPNDVRRTS